MNQNEIGQTMFSVGLKYRIQSKFV